MALSRRGKMLTNNRAGMDKNPKTYSKGGKKSSGRKYSCGGKLKK